jgi:hypothetical protein
MTDVEFGIYLAINYARSFTDYYHDNEVTNNPTLLSYLETWPSYTDTDNEFSLKGFSFSSTL